MKKNTFTSSIEQGLIISTTSFSQHYHDRDIVLPWDKGSAKIVPMIEKVLHKTTTQKTFSQQTPFVPQFVFSMKDEMSLFDTNAMPVNLWSAASDYQDWILNDCKGTLPDFKEVVDTLCSGRLSLFIGLGGYIFCELHSDSQHLLHYYS